uniref:EF-hand domain-containing protein n=1 Tax=Pyrodinium bahamense TaxID=73915 RepID=A0A7R9ZYN8_9DINO|mmetsp:Transcript_15276/g.42194  ORF Transcript_15276/g.42194 Transcript_15276/m.42194 type:complete len:259 (+) Transcript_15276:44-820(+)
MQRGEPTSFSRIFGGGTDGSAGDQRPPSVHELFSAAMRDDLSLPHFAQALVSLHGVRLTPAASRLLSSVDATSGRLTFAQFQKALAQDSDGESCKAGLPSAFQDQAKAIIEDNLGAPSAPPPAAAAKHSTDISADPFVRQQRQLEKRETHGPFSGNPVRKTNAVSAGNTLAAPHQESRGDRDEGALCLANTATRMFVSGELDRMGYEKFLRRFGLQLTPESELQRLVVRQEQTGDCPFAELAKAFQRELARSEAGGSC